MIFKGKGLWRNTTVTFYILQGIFLNGKGICFILCDTRGKILGGGFCAMSEKNCTFWKSVKFAVNQSNQCGLEHHLSRRLPGKECLPRVGDKW